MQDRLPSATVVLHNIRSAHNVGAIFRTADAVGVSEILLVGYTPTPLDRFGRSRADIAKAALGAEKAIPWRHISDIEACVAELRARGVTIVTVEQSPRAVDYKMCMLQGDTAFVFGNEVDGVPAAVVASADACIHIPMHGVKESLNVSVSAGIVLFRLLDT